MPPQARSITSYFTKPAASTASASAGLSPAGPAKRPISTPPKAVPKEEVENMPPTSDTKPVVVEQSERVVKKARLSKPKSIAQVAKVTESASSTIAAKRAIPATSVSDLRERLDAQRDVAPLLDLELCSMREDWLLALQDELTKPYFIKLKEFVTAEQKSKKVFPPAEDIYSWSRFCPLKDVRIVIIGQDPYHDDGQAHGLAFSVRKGVRIPPSLRNIYKEMATEVPGFMIPKHGDLTEWAKHGVLLLNTALTVRAHTAGSHSKAGWDQFTSAVLKVVTDRLAPSEGESVGANGVVFMAWGNHAAKMCAGVDTNKHLLLKSAHPSPLSASRGFFGNNHFNLANTWLEDRYGADGGIDWKSLGAEETA